MLVKEFFKTRDDGVELYRTYSDEGYLIEKDGVFYGDAIDIEEKAEGYTETNILPEDEEVSE